MKKINLKVANFAHARFLFNLYNSSIAKGFSITKKKINFKDHLKWLKTKIDNEFSKIYIGYINLRKIGYVRFEKKNGQDNHSLRTDSIVSYNMKKI